MGHDAMEGPLAPSWEASASRQATRMGLAFVALTTASINFFGDIFNFSTLMLTPNF